jgi:hypothetical protein
VLFLCFLLSNTTCTYHMLPLLFVIDLLLSLHLVFNGFSGKN